MSSSIIETHLQRNCKLACVRYILHGITEAVHIIPHIQCMLFNSAYIKYVQSLCTKAETIGWLVNRRKM